MKKDQLNKIWSLANLAGLIAVLVLNTLANSLPLNGMGTGEISDSYPNLFVPAGITFAIWGVIYLLLIGFVARQLLLAFSRNRDSFPLERFGPFFFLSCMVNSLWIIAWHWKLVGLSFLIMLALLSSLIVIYLRINGGNERGDKVSYVFFRMPFSVYLGWITVATIANVTALLVNIGWNRFGLSPVFWTIAVLAAGTVITAMMLVLRKDIAYALVVLWAFAGILIKRSASAMPPDRGVEIGVTICLVILGALTLFTLFKKIRTHKS